jgi:hypothetical protein
LTAWSECSSERDRSAGPGGTSLRGAAPGYRGDSLARTHHHVVAGPGVRRGGAGGNRRSDGGAGARSRRACGGVPGAGTGARRCGRAWGGDPGWHAAFRVRLRCGDRRIDQSRAGCGDGSGQRRAHLRYRGAGLGPVRPAVVCGRQRLPGLRCCSADRPRVARPTSDPATRITTTPLPGRNSPLPGVSRRRARYVGCTCSGRTA